MSRHGRLTAAAIALNSIALLAQGSADARFQFQRTVEAAAGQQRLDVDVALLAGAQPFTVTQRGGRSIAAGGLGDLRLFSADNVEIPYLLVPPSPDTPVFVTGTPQPITATKETSGFEADLGAPTEIDALDIVGIPGPFLKRFMLEGSGDRARWTQLIAEGTAFNLPAEQLRHTQIEFQPGSFRYLRITWDDRNSGRVPAPNTVVARRRSVSSPGPVLRAPLAVEQRPSEPGRSRFRITLPAARQPIVALELNVGGGHLMREARVLEAGLVGDQAQPQQIGQARLIRVVRDQMTADALEIAIRPPNEPQIDLVVDDGDNPPLELTSVTAVFAELPWIYFESQPAVLTARYGDPKLAAPRYDLEAMRDTIPSAPSKAAWRSDPPMTLVVAEAEGLPMPDTGSAIATTGFAYMREIPPGPGGLITLPLDASVMAHSGLAPRRLRDLRVIDRGGLQIPYLLERRDEPLIIDARVERRDLPSDVTGPSGRLTSYVVNIPYSELPSSRVVFTTRARVFRRPVTLGVIVPAADRRPAEFSRLNSATWTHADQSTAAPSLTFELPDVRRGDLYLLIEEGDNQPLPIEKATVLLPSYALRLFRRPELALRLVYGSDDIQAPSYDLQLLAPQLMGRRANDVVPGPEQQLNPDVRETVPTVSPTVFWAALALAVAVLLVLVVRLIRRDAEAL